jgi:hypothetical protein
MKIIADPNRTPMCLTHMPAWHYIVILCCNSSARSGRILNSQLGVPSSHFINEDKAKHFTTYFKKTKVSSSKGKCCHSCFQEAILVSF